MTGAAEPTRPVRDRAPVPLVLGAAGDAELRRAAAELAQALTGADDSGLRAAARRLAEGHREQPYRAVVIADGPQDARTALAALGEGGSSAALVRGTPDGGRLGYLFTFQGSQRAGMGRELYAAVPAFADAFDEVCRALDPHLERPLQDIVFADPGTPEAEELEQTGWAAPAIFAVEAALHALLDRWGLRPAVLAGGSVGDFATAHAAGLFGLADAAYLVAQRAGLMQRLPGTGTMWTVRAPEAEVVAALDGLTDRACIGLYNGPETFVLAGDRAAVDTAAERLTARGRTGRPLRVSHPFHSPLVEPMLEPFRQVAARVTPRSPRVAMVDSLTGRRADPAVLSTAEWWVRHVREPVRFRESVRHLEDSGVTTYLELGPLAMQSLMVRSCLSRPERAEAVPALRHQRPEPWALLHALARVHVRGAWVDWRTVLADTDRSDRTAAPAPAAVEPGPIAV